jgi:integrase
MLGPGKSSPACGLSFLSSHAALRQTSIPVRAFRAARTVFPALATRALPARAGGTLPAHLDALEIGMPKRQNTNWKGELKEVLDKNNGQHATLKKVVSHGTRDKRGKGLFRIFGLLRKMGLGAMPRNLGERHVRALVAYWTAEPEFAKELEQRNVELKPRTVPFSSAYIQQQMSFLRTFAGWIGKPGLVKSAKAYAPAELVSRELCAKRDRSFRGNGVDKAAVLKMVAAYDEYVGVQFEVMIAFGLRCKEAVMFTPHLAEVPAHALPASAGDTPYLAFLRIKRGTKGGRLRFTAIRHEEQRVALNKAKALARHHGHIGRPGLTLKQAMRRFSDVMRAVGLTKRGLGVTAHGLRHEFAADLYIEIAEVEPPIRGGDIDAHTMNAAYLEVARQLGHGRPQVAGAYLGPRKHTRKSDQGPAGKTPSSHPTDGGS